MHISNYNNSNSQYPPLLREISSPPKQLYIRGTIRNDIPLVAIVGTRRPTAYGKQVTYQLASELAAAGVGIVSGLAIGLDAVAHQAALDAGGYTIAVLGCGIDIIYPSSNRLLGEAILTHSGAIISEHSSGVPPLPHHFPARNRIISGISLATIVTEADLKSGTLITANMALDQNRLVLAVPGNITSKRSAGPNQLICSGAVPVTSSGDVLSILNLSSLNSNYKEVAPSNNVEAKIMQLIREGTTTNQLLIEAMDVTASEFASIISMMEITGKVRGLGAGIWMVK